MPIGATEFKASLGVKGDATERSNKAGAEGKGRELGRLSKNSGEPSYELGMINSLQWAAHAGSMPPL